MGVMQGGVSDGENPKAAAVREQLRKRLGEQEEKERATKTELVQKAASYLEQFYEVRARSLHTTLRLPTCRSRYRHECGPTSKLPVDEGNRQHVS